MEAIQAANQLASAQTNQLLQIRSLLVAQQNAAATLAQAQADKEAQQAAASEQLRNGDEMISLHSSKAGLSSKENMKLKLLSTVALITTFLITGCDGEDKTDCKKDPTCKRMSAL